MCFVSWHPTPRRRVSRTPERTEQVLVTDHADTIRTRLLAIAQLVTAPLVLSWFFVVEPGLIPEWPGYVIRCALCVVDGRRR